ncbi:hypothetical protein GLOIN_2v1868421 [Rhizophagus irregularis DAOM 181602=DAOM 197198]|nr:hypothetical protein GLOIN_2v1868421 [Rhizophagus irregularis DAOM 181602=DAOM 197198]
MSVQFFSKLSQNYIGLLKDDEYYDITIEVGKDPNENILSHIKFSNISSENFQIILEYIYGGILSLNGQEILDIMNILVAADVLHLQELVDYLQTYLVENNPEWIEQHFGFTQQIASRSNNLLELKEFCTRLMAKSPEKILKSIDFTSLSEKSLISLIKRDDLQMREVENILQNCLPLVRFFSLSSKEFSRKVRPYQKLLDHQLYENLLSYYLDPEIVSTHKILRPRKTVLLDNDTQIIESRIIDLNIASTISKWIDKIVINDDNFREFYLPYKFELLLRVKGTEEILGGRGPQFGVDIVCGTSDMSTSKDYNHTYCKKNFYEKAIRDTSGYFTIEDYEVFQIMKS